MNAIVAVTDDWGIGRDGALLVRNREDMRHFVRQTMGGTVIMGRKTLQSFPGGRPLKGRRNIVLTGDPTQIMCEAPEGGSIEVATGIDDVLRLVEGDDPQTVWVIGGESVYRQLLDRCERVVVTKNHVTVPADAFFPNLNELDGWKIVEKSGNALTDEGVPFEFIVYEAR